MLKQFDGRFYNNSSTPRHFGETNIFGLAGLLSPVGLLYAILTALLLVTVYARRCHSNRDFSDQSCTALESLHPPPDSARVWGRPIHDSRVGSRSGHSNCSPLFKLCFSF